MLRDVTCSGNIPVVLKEHRFWTFGMCSWRFFTDLKCSETAVNCVGLCLCGRSYISCCVRRHEQQLHVCRFFCSGVVWNAGDRCAAFYRN